MISDFENATHPKYLIKLVCCVCSRMFYIKITDSKTYFYPIHYLASFKHLLHYNNLSYENTFNCNELFKYNGPFAILTNSVLNRNSLSNRTNDVSSRF